MGLKESKEEVIIAQAGNSGGSTTSQEIQRGVSLGEVVALIAVALVLAIVVAYCYLHGKKKLERKIRRGIIRSQEIA